MPPKAKRAKMAKPVARVNPFYNTSTILETPAPATIGFQRGMRNFNSPLAPGQLFGRYVFNRNGASMEDERLIERDATLLAREQYNVPAPVRTMVPATGQAISSSSSTYMPGMDVGQAPIPVARVAPMPQQRYVNPADVNDGPFFNNGGSMVGHLPQLQRRGGGAFAHFKGPFTNHLSPMPYIETGGRRVLKRGRKKGSGLAQQLMKISPYNNGPHNGEDFAYQTVYNQILYGKPKGGTKRRMAPAGGGIGTSLAKQAVKLVKGYSNLIGTTGLKEPNKALWGKGRKKVVKRK